MGTVPGGPQTIQGCRILTRGVRVRSSAGHCLFQFQPKGFSGFGGHGPKVAIPGGGLHGRPAKSPFNFQSRPF